jgi:hypothetical protein
MSTQVQIRRGNTIQTAAFTGAIAELTVDTDKKTLVVHDGSTAGGTPLAKESSLSANAIFSQAAFNQANTSFITATSAGIYANGAFAAANIAGGSAGSYANAAFNQANTAVNNALSASNYANGAFTSSNTIQTYVTSANANISLLFSYVNTANANITAAFAAANASTATDATQNTSITASFVAANSAGVYANGAFAAANNAAGVDLTQNNSITAAFTQANTGVNNALSASNYANGAFTTANSATNTATAAYTRANNSVNANTGGTITGDLVVTGNLTISGQTTYSNTVQLLVGDNLITLNAELPTSVTPVENAGIEINRGNTFANASLLWVESAGKWQANTGSATGAYFLANEAAATSAGIYANGAFTQANTDVTNVSVAAGTYGNTTHYGVVTVAANGRVTSVSTFAVSDPSSLAFSIALG